jgi:hypothetical protein
MKKIILSVLLMSPTLISMAQKNNGFLKGMYIQW